MTEDDKKMNRLEEIFVSSMAMSEMTPVRPILSVANLHRFMTDPNFKLSQEQQRVLFSNRDIKLDYQSLKAEMSVFELPLVAAASDGTVTKRVFPGGVVEVMPTGTGGRQFHIITTTKDPDKIVSILHIESAHGEIARCALGKRRSDGRYQTTVDTTNEADELLMRLLTDPALQGAIL